MISTIDQALVWLQLHGYGIDYRSPIVGEEQARRIDTFIEGGKYLAFGAPVRESWHWCENDADVIAFAQMKKAEVLR